MIIQKTYEELRPRTVNIVTYLCIESNTVTCRINTEDPIKRSIRNKVIGDFDLNERYGQVAYNNFIEELAMTTNLTGLTVVEGPKGCEFTRLCILRELIELVNSLKFRYGKLKGKIASMLVLKDFGLLQPLSDCTITSGEDVVIKANSKEVVSYLYKAISEERAKIFEIYNKPL